MITVQKQFLPLRHHRTCLSSCSEPGPEVKALSLASAGICASREDLHVNQPFQG